MPLDALLVINRLPSSNSKTDESSDVDSFHFVGDEEKDYAAGGTGKLNLNGLTMKKYADDDGETGGFDHYTEQQHGDLGQSFQFQIFEGDMLF